LEIFWMRLLKKFLVAFIVIAGIIGLFIGAGYGGYRYLMNKKKAAEKVRYTQAKRGDLKVILKETATLKPRKVVELKSKVSGRIVNLYFKAGAVIDAGSVVAEIDREEYARQLEMAEKELERARQAVEALLPEGEIVTEPEKIDAREMATLVDVVLIDYGSAKVNYQNMKKMYARDLISLKALDDAERAYDTAYVAYHHNVRQATKTLTEAEVSHEQALENLSETTLRAPVTGVLTKLLVEAGELVQGTGNMSPGTAIGEVADLSEMIALVNLNEVDVGKVAIGDPVTLTIDSEDDDEFRGKVESISPSGELQNNIVTFEVKILLQDKFDFFKPEMTANADILVDEATGVLQVPLEAIEEKKGTKRVTVLTPDPEYVEEKSEAPEEESEKEEGEEESDEGVNEKNVDEDSEDFYQTQFAPKRRFKEKTVEVKTGLTNELWAEVVEGVTEEVTLKLPDLKPVVFERGPH
jgi:HlyD family secretion protein